MSRVCKERELTHVGKGVERLLNAYQEGLCRSSSCVSACLCCVSANRHSVLSCRRSLIRPMIVPYSCVWQKPSQHFLPACAALHRRLASSKVGRTCDCW